MNLRILAMTEDKAKAILDMLARKMGYLQVKFKYNKNTKQTSLTVFSDGFKWNDLYFYKEPDCSQHGLIQSVRVPYGIYRDALAIMFVFIEQGYDVTIYDGSVFMRAGTTVDELLVQLDLEV